MTDMIHKKAERIKISADVFLLYVGVWVKVCLKMWEVPSMMS